jgi:hypothetical protein
MHLSIHWLCKFLQAGAYAPNMAYAGVYTHQLRLGTEFQEQVSGARCQVSGAEEQVPGARCQVLGVRRARL